MLGTGRLCPCREQWTFDELKELDSEPDPMRGMMGTQSSPVKSYDYLLKFLLVGDSDVGKGEILDSLQDGSVEAPYAYSSGECPHSSAAFGVRSTNTNSMCVVDRY